MLATIKHYTRSGLSSIAAAALLLITIPITIGITLIMFFVGILTLATVRHRLRKSVVTGDLPSNTRKCEAGTENKQQKPPIEGSYTVINK